MRGGFRLHGLPGDVGLLTGLGDLDAAVGCRRDGQSARIGLQRLLHRTDGVVRNPDPTGDLASTGFRCPLYGVPDRFTLCASFNCRHAKLGFSAYAKREAEAYRCISPQRPEVQSFLLLVLALVLAAAVFALVIVLGVAALVVVPAAVAAVVLSLSGRGGLRGRGRTRSRAGEADLLQIF